MVESVQERITPTGNRSLAKSGFRTRLKLFTSIQVQSG